MKFYECIFSKYDDVKTVEQELKRPQLKYSDSIYFIVQASSLKNAFENLAKTDAVNVFWNKHRTIHPFYVNNSGNCIYYHKQFEL